MSVIMDSCKTGCLVTTEMRLCMDRSKSVELNREALHRAFGEINHSISIDNGRKVTVIIYN